MLRPSFDGIKTITPAFDDILTLIDKTFLYQRLWQLPKPKTTDEKTKYDLIYLNTLNLAKKENIIVPKINYAHFKCRHDGNGIIVENDYRGTRFDFPRDKTEPHFCLADLFKDFITMILITVGGKTTNLATKLHKNNQYSQVLYIKGFASACAEATIEYAHNFILNELNATKEFSKRFSLGYKSCPNLMDQEKFMKLLRGSEIGIILSQTYQLIPEYSASAFVTFTE